MHGGRVAYYVIGEDIVPEPEYLSSATGGCPMSAASSAGQLKCPPFRFGRLFPKWGAGLKDGERLEAAKKIIPSLIKLGQLMNDPTGGAGGPVAPTEDSGIPSGYTYLGQFIAHEITFDDTQDLPPIELIPDNLRSPSLDLDSLYGGAEDKSAQKDDKNPARLKVGTTVKGRVKVTFENDLPREEGKPDKALIGDPRNDENLAVAQTHLAFIKFHNRVVDDLEHNVYKNIKDCPPGELFETARMEVVRHFQWIVVYDFLRKIVDGDVLKAVLGGDLRLKRFEIVESEKDLFMPLEFSAAAFRIGHSMVRRTYQWNRYQSRELGGNAAVLSQLVTLAKRPLVSDWIIDWRRFYDFQKDAPELGYAPPLLPEPELNGKPNMAKKIDTKFDFRLDRITGFDHRGLPEEKRSIPVRNLLRGLALGLPWGEDVAGKLEETVLTREEVTSGPHRALLDDPALGGKTPLWYYILKEAELKGKEGRLGPVGSRIVAETLVGIIRHSSHSILKKPDWRPAYGPATSEPEGVRFWMVDLLHAARVVDPLGEQIKQVNSK